MGEGVAVEVGFRGADRHAEVGGEGEAEGVVGAGGQAPPRVAVGPEVGRAGGQTGPVAGIAEGGRTGRADLDAEGSRRVGEGVAGAGGDAETVDSVGVAEGVGWATLDAGVGGVVAEGALRAVVGWAHVDAETGGVVGEETALGEVNAGCCIVEYHGGGVEVGAAISAESCMWISKVVQCNWAASNTEMCGVVPEVADIAVGAYCFAMCSEVVL